MKIVIFVLTFIIFIIEPSFAGKTRIIVKDGLPPVTFVENGKIQGLAVDVVKEIQKRLGSTESWEVLPWSRANRMVQERSNIILLTLARTDERKKFLYYLGPIAATETALFAREDYNEKIPYLEAVNDEKVAVRFDTHSEATMLRHGFHNLQTTTSIRQNILLVHSGRVRFICDTTMEIQGATKKYNLPPLKKVYVVGTTDLYIAFSKDTDKKVLEKWKQTFKSIKDDGTFKAIYSKWLPNEKPPMGVDFYPPGRRISPSGPLNIGYKINLGL